MHAPATPDAPGHVTPSMAQYVEIKAANPDCLLFYRMGDFYELFFADAEVASRALGIVLTKRGKHHGQDIPMCGVPIARADDYLQRLIALGHRVAVCEQLEDPAEARKRGSKAIVRRDVVRLVTPGTVTEEALLEPGRACLLVAVARGRTVGPCGLAEVDISTGRFAVRELPTEALAAELARLEPREVVVPDSLLDDPALKTLWRELKTAITPAALEGLDGTAAERRLRSFFEVSTLEGFGSLSRVELAAAATAIAYVERTQRGSRPALSPPQRLTAERLLAIDAATRANLELTRTLSGQREGSLLACIDLTVMPGGGRLLAERLAGPLTDAAALRQRLATVAWFHARRTLTDHLRQRLKGAPDLARALGRLSLQRGGPRDLAAVRDGLGLAVQLGLALAEPEADAPPAELTAMAQQLARADLALATTLAQALADGLPLARRDGGFVRAGHEPALDEALALRDQSRQVIAGLQSRYQEQCEARTLRIKHNNFLGFFVEVPAALGERLLAAPLSATFIHRQTMQGAMRFSTAELGDLEARIASAGERALQLELAIFDRLAAAVLAAQEGIKAISEALAALDVATALATLAERHAWTMPAISEDTRFHIVGGRHPVVEAAVREQGQSFIANDCQLADGDGTAGGLWLVTGPNMAGKSTFLRQNALMVVLAQMGSFVPAARAEIGIVDRLFSRVGAADDLARGRSTFMVEMVEAAAILNQAGPRSLVILDEIGRGTATFDGLSIAWAAIEHLHDHNRSRTLFATHYHELTTLAERLPRLVNVTMRVTEHRGDVIFLHEVVKGAADRSYGIQVAKLAGLPRAVVQRARAVLAELERADRQSPRRKLADDLPLFAAMTAPEPEPPAAAVPAALATLLDGLDPDELTPRQAQEALYALLAAWRSVKTQG